MWSRLFALCVLDLSAAFASRTAFVAGVQTPRYRFVGKDGSGRKELITIIQKLEVETPGETGFARGRFIGGPFSPADFSKSAETLALSIDGAPHSISLSTNCSSLEVSVAVMNGLFTQGKIAAEASAAADSDGRIEIVSKASGLKSSVRVLADGTGPGACAMLGFASSSWEDDIPTNFKMAKHKEAEAKAQQGRARHTTQHGLREEIHRMWTDLSHDEQQQFHSTLHREVSGSLRNEHLGEDDASKLAAEQVQEVIAGTKYESLMILEFVQAEPLSERLERFDVESTQAGALFESVGRLLIADLLIDNGDRFIVPGVTHSLGQWESNLGNALVKSGLKLVAIDHAVSQAAPTKHAEKRDRIEMFLGDFAQTGPGEEFTYDTGRQKARDYHSKIDGAMMDICQPERPLTSTVESISTEFSGLEPFVRRGMVEAIVLATNWPAMWNPKAEPGMFKCLETWKSEWEMLYGADGKLSLPYVRAEDLEALQDRIRCFHDNAYPRLLGAGHNLHAILARLREERDAAVPLGPEWNAAPLASLEAPKRKARLDAEDTKRQELARTLTKIRTEVVRHSQDLSRFKEAEAEPEPEPELEPEPEPEL